MIPEISGTSGHLPPGRYLATLAEVQEQFVPGGDTDPTGRQGIWAEWLRSTELLRAVVPVATVWLSGSFISAKVNPSDLDCTYWVDHDALVAAQADALRQKRLALFFDHGWLKAQGLRVDPYLGVWRQVLEPSQRLPEDANYYWARGQWDDFWQRTRTGPVGAPPSRADALPTRGYLEVTLDGYSS